MRIDAELTGRRRPNVTKSPDNGRSCSTTLESNRAEFFGCKKGHRRLCQTRCRDCMDASESETKATREDQHWMRQIFRGLCPIIAIGGEASSSIRGRPNRKWPSHARWSLRRRWRRVGAGSIPRIGQAFGLGAGSRGLAGRQAVERAAAPTGIVHALDAKRILRYASLGRSRNVIDRPESCCSEQRGEGDTDHFRTFMAGEALFSGAIGIDRAGTSQRAHE